MWTRKIGNQTAETSMPDRQHVPPEPCDPPTGPPPKPSDARPTVTPPDAVLVAATNPDGSRRFYPPFEHPATARLRAEVEALEALPESESRDQALAYCREQMARFEVGEDRAKRDYLGARRGR